MNLPDRILTDRPLKCCACGVDLPPAVTAFSIGGGVYCEKCMWKMKQLAAIAPIDVQGPKFGFTGFVPGEDFDWPEDLDV